MRKLLFTAMLTLTATAAHATEWEYIEQIDPMNDNDASFAYTKSGDAHLALRCNDGDAELILFNGSYLGSDGTYSLTYRIDSEQPQTVNTDAYQTGTALLLPDRLQALFEPAGQVVMRVVDFRGRTHTHEFTLSGYYDATGLLSCVE